jgi:hypothetical protein
MGGKIDELHALAQENFAITHNLYGAAQNRAVLLATLYLALAKLRIKKHREYGETLLRDTCVTFL